MATSTGPTFDGRRDVRIRQVKPEFWTDPVTARLTDAARLFYIGLWNLADDDGFLVWDQESIGATLFPYETPRRRVTRINRSGGELVEAERLVVYACGHAEVPTLKVHQRLSGPTKRVQTESRKHASRQCPHIPAPPRGSSHLPATEQGTGNRERNGTEQGTERNGSARATEKVVYRDGEWVYVGAVT